MSIPRTETCGIVIIFIVVPILVAASLQRDLSLLPHTQPFITCDATDNASFACAQNRAWARVLRKVLKRAPAVTFSVEQPTDNRHRIGDECGHAVYVRVLMGASMDVEGLSHVTAAAAAGGT